MRQDDIEWRQLVQWVLFVLVNAEERSWTSNSANSESNQENALNVPDAVTSKLGLQPDWERKIIQAVGHYGEIFERNLGKSSPLKIDRGVNALWTQGGILYAPPVR